MGFHRPWRSSLKKINKMGLFSKPKKVKAPKMNIGNDINAYTSGMAQGLPSAVNLEQQYRPQFQGLNLGDINSSLNGAGGNQGLFGLGSQSNQQAGQQINSARATDISGMTGQAGAVRGLFDELNPQGAAMVQQAQDQATTAQTNATGLTPQESRDAQQFALSVGNQSGRVGDNTTIAQQFLNRDSILTQKRQEASNATQNALNSSNNFYGQPGLQALSQIPNSYQAGQSYLSQGQQAIGRGTPQMLDLGAGLNLGAADRQNQMGANSANAQNAASSQAGMLGLFGKVAGGIANVASGGITGGLSGLFGKKKTDANGNPIP